MSVSAARKVKAGATSVVLDDIFIEDSTSNVGGGLTGLVFNSAGLTCYYHRNKASASVAVSLATMALGTWATGGFKEVDAANMPGSCTLCPPDAAFAAGAESVTFYLQGAANMIPLIFSVEITVTDNQDGTRGGMTAMPNAAAGANAGLPVLSNSATTLGYTVTNLTNAPTSGDLTATMKASVTTAATAATPTAAAVTGNVGGNVVGAVGSAGSVTGDVVGNVNGKVLGTGSSTITGIGVQVDQLASATVDSATANTITLAALSLTPALVADNVIAGDKVRFVSPSVACGQERTITAYDAALGVLTLDRDLIVQPVAADGLVILYGSAPALDSALSVLNAVNLTNAPTAGDFTAVMKTSLATAAAGGGGMKPTRSTGALLGTDETTGVSLAAGASVASSEVDLLGDNTSVGTVEVYAVFTASGPVSFRVALNQRRLTGQGYVNVPGQAGVNPPPVQVNQFAAATVKIALGRFTLGRFVTAVVTNAAAPDSAPLTNLAILYELEKLS